MPWELTSRSAFASQSRLIVDRHLFDNGKGRQPCLITLGTDRQRCSSGLPAAPTHIACQRTTGVLASCRSGGVQPTTIALLAHSQLQEAVLTVQCAH